MKLNSDYKQWLTDLKSRIRQSQIKAAVKVNCKQFYLFYTQGDSIRQQLVGEIENHPIFQIPWGHHIQIFSKSKSVKEAFFYVQKKHQKQLEQRHAGIEELEEELRKIT